MLIYLYIIQGVVQVPCVALSGSQTCLKYICAFLGAAASGRNSVPAKLGQHRCLGESMKEAEVGILGLREGNVGDGQLGSRNRGCQIPNPGSLHLLGSAPPPAATQKKVDPLKLLPHCPG